MSMVRRASLPGANNNGSRKEKLRTKTPSVNDLSKKFKNTPRGKRRLEFQPKQPLKDKKFYLDLHGYKKIPSLAARIKELGGKVEEFFNKDITYLITNRKDADTRLSPRSNSTPSPGMSVPSPFPFNKSSSMKGSALPSPISADSPQSFDTHQTVPKLDTRGRTLQKQATLMSTTKFGTSNVLTNAKAWGISVIHLDKVLEKLAEYGPSKVDKQPSIKELRSGKKELRVEIRKLQVPFIKVEDQSRHYQPLVKEFKEWPLLNFNTPVGTCPFDSPKENKESELKRKIKEKDNQEGKKQNKKGYCECCCMHYDALDLHLKGDHHKAFASRDSNYDSLDKLIKQGPSLRLFLDKVKLKYSNTQSTEPPSSENKVDNPFQTPTKEPVNLIDDAIIAEEVNDIIGENLTAESDMEKANHKGIHNTDVENGIADDQCMGASSGAKDNSPASAQEGSTDLPARRKTRSQDSAKSETHSDPEVKPHSPNVFIEQKTLDPSRHNEGENETHEFIVQNAQPSSQKVVSPDQSGALEETVDERGDNDIQESLSSQEPCAKVSFTSVKPHKTDDHDEDEGNRRVLRRQKSNCGYDNGPEGDKNEVPKRALRGQRKDPGSTDCDDSELPKQVLRSQRKIPESTNGDENNVPQRVLRRSQRKTNYSSDSTDFQVHEVPKRALRCQRKTNCSSDSTETLTSLEGLRHSPAKHDFGTNNVSSTDTLPETGNDDAILQDGSRAGSKILLLQQNGITRETSSERQKTPEEDDTRKDAEVKEDFSSPKSGLNGTKQRHHETIISDDSDSDSDESTKAKVGDRFTPKLVIPLSFWSKLPECQPKKENPDDLLNEALDQQDKTVDQELDGIAKMKDDDLTALFNSDDDDDKSFEGFDVPHFEGSKSSEQDHLTYQIKKIVEYYTESQDDTLVNTTNEEVEDQDGENGLTRGTEKKKKKRKQQPHGIKIILSSRTDDDDDNVFQDDFDEDEDVDDECDDDDDDDSSSTVADSTDGEDEELLSSSALCMDSFTYKRKSWNLEDDDIGLHLPVKRRRTITDEDSSLRSAEDQETGDQADSDVESRRTTRASTRLSSNKEKSGHKNALVDMGDTSIDTGNKKMTRSARASTRTTTSSSKGMPKHARGEAENTVIREEKRNARTSTRGAQSDKRISNEQSDDEHVPIKDVSHKESNKATKRKTRASSRISNASSDHKENYPANVECDSRSDEKSTRRKTRATKLEDNIDSDNLSLEKDDMNKETRRKRRSSERASCTKERTLNDGKDIHANEKPRRKSRTSKDLSSTKEEDKDDVGEQSENDEACHTRVTTRNKKETIVDLRTKNDQQIKSKTKITSEKKENNKQKTAESEVPPSTPTTNDVANNDSLSSSVMGDISCTSDSSFLKSLPQELVKMLSVHTSIEERVKLRTRNKIKPKPTPVRQNTIEKRKETNVKGKSDLQVMIVDSGKASNKKHDIKTESTNVAESSNTPRLRSRSLNQDVENSKNFTKSRNLRGASVASSPQKKPLSSTSSSLDTSPVVTPIRTRKHWIFDPGHFSSSTPQPLRKVKTKTSPKTENRFMTTRGLRDANKCLMAGDRYEFVDEDVFAFDD